MIFQWLEGLKGKRIVLASGSPRRVEILRSIHLNVEVTPSTFEENLDPKSFGSVPEFVIATATGKAEEVALRCGDAEVIVAADTVVVDDGEVVGKPGGDEEAKRMLKRLSSRTHTVYTGVVVIWPRTSTVVKFCEGTDVTFGGVSDSVIEDYVRTGEPLDKAGAYGIQGLGGTLIEKINGDYYTVMGLPLHKFCYHVDLYYKQFGMK